MADLIEVRDGHVVHDDAPHEGYLPVGTPVAEADGFDVGIGMELEGPYDRDGALARIAHLQRSTRVEFEAEDRKKRAR